MKITLLSDDKLLRPDDVNLPGAFAAKGCAVEVVNWNTCDIANFDSDLVLIRTPWDYVSNSNKFIELLKNLEVKAKVLHSTNLVTWNMDKKYLSNLYARGFPVVPTYVIPHFEKEKLSKFDKLLPDKFVVKSRIGASGKDTFKLDKQASSFPELDALIGQDVLVQPFIPGILDEGEFSFIFFGKEFSHAVLKTASEGEFRIQEVHGGHVKAYHPSEKELLEITELFKSFNLDTIYARVDVVRNNAKFLLMELEIIEPELFFRFGVGSEDKFVEVIIKSL